MEFARGEPIFRRLGPVRVGRITMALRELPFGNPRQP
jgi:hypothetical protein